MANQYFTCVLDAWRDGDVLYGRMHYYRSGSYTYTDTSFPTPTMNLGGTVYYDNDFANRVHSGIVVGDVYSTTFSRTVAGSGDRTVTWSAGSGLRSDFAGTWSKTVYFPEKYTDPSGLSISIVEKYTNGAKFNVSLSSYGNPSGEAGRYIEAGIMAQNSYGSTYRYTHGPHGSSSMSQQITVTNSTYTGGSLSIKANTQYYYGGYATNTQRNISKVQGTFVTLAPAPTLSVNRVTDKTAVIDFSVVADGGYYAKNIQYSLDNGTTWKTGATINGGSSATGSFTIYNLTHNTSYTLLSRVSTTSGTTGGNTLTFKTEISNRFYCSVNGSTKLIKKFYGSVNGRTKEIVKMYGPVVNTTTPISGTYYINPESTGNITGFDINTFLNTIKNDAELLYGLEYDNIRFSYLDLLAFYADEYQGDLYWEVYLSFKDPVLGEWTFGLSDTGNPYSLAELGITANITGEGIDIIELDVEDETTYKSKIVYQT